jgi:HJR/Mrr/RecB family endonuclease
MIKVNLIKAKKTTTITIPFGWIFVALVAVGCAAGLYVANTYFQDQLVVKREELEEVKKNVRNLKRYDTQQKQHLETKRTLENEFNRYENVLSPTAGGWTPTLLLFEDLLKQSETVWLRDLRIDGDGRVTLNGVSKGQKADEKKRMPGITTLYEQISNRKTKFKSVRLKRIQKTQEQRKDVSQFELTCVLIR